MDNDPPISDAGPDKEAIIGEIVQFDGHASFDPDGTIVLYSWNFGDGTTTTTEGAVVSHSTAAAGTYVVTLNTMDDLNASASDTAAVTVSDLTPELAIEGLIQLVEEMNLQQGIANSLDAKLAAVQEALAAVNAGVREDAINKLEALVNAVEAQSGKQLTNEQADELVVYAAWIIEALSEPPCLCPCCSST